MADIDDTQELPPLCFIDDVPAIEDPDVRGERQPDAFDGRGGWRCRRCSQVFSERFPTSSGGPCRSDRG